MLEPTIPLEIQRDQMNMRVEWHAKQLATTITTAMTSTTKTTTIVRFTDVTRTKIQ